MRKNSVKNVRINGEVQKALSEIIRTEVKDPRIRPMTSVTEVSVAPDLKTCKVYISVLGAEDELKETVKGLRQAAPFIRSQLARRVNLRNTPELSFYGDPSIAHGVELIRKIDEAVAAIPEREEETDDEA